MTAKNDEITLFFYEFCENCKKVIPKKFTKNEIITTYIAKRKQLCLLKSRRSRFN